MKVLAKTTIKKTAVTIQKRLHGFYVEWTGPTTQGSPSFASLRPPTKYSQQLRPEF